MVDSVSKRFVEMCHESRSMDSEDLAVQLTANVELTGSAVVPRAPTTVIRQVGQQSRRVGPLRYLDVLAFTLYLRYQNFSLYGSWVADQVAGLKRAYPVDLSATPRLITGSTNSPAPIQAIGYA